jgi:mannose-6-phosphate isomerase-like protein (cupin superfamily)
MITYAVPGGKYARKRIHKVSYRGIWPACVRGFSVWTTDAEEGARHSACLRGKWVPIASGGSTNRGRAKRVCSPDAGTLVILHGQGDALLDGSKKVSFTAPAAVYIPPQTHHDVLNTGKEPLEYVYVVAPVTTQ